MRTVYKLIFLSFFISQLAGCNFISDVVLDRPHPTDSSLIANFEANEADFNRLVQMCEEDANMVRIAPEFLWRTDHAGWPRPESEWGITRERWDEYRKLFKKVDLDNGLVNYQPDLIHMFASNKGLLTGGSSKGYAYSIKTPALIADVLDNYEFQPPHKDIEVVYRRIKGNWYLYFEVSG